jgi:phage-related protein
MNYIIFRGIRSDTIGLKIEKMPSHKRAEIRQTEYEIPGRDGALHVTEGYAAFDMQITVTMMDASASLRQTVNAWADGTGDLILSDDLTKCYRASVWKEVSYTRRKYGEKYYDTAKITFRCQPFVYEAVPSVYTYTQNSAIVNLGNIPSLPLIKVTGQGDCSFSIGGQTVTLKGVSGEVTLDCEAGYAYSEKGAVTMNGSFPEIGLNDSAVTLGANVTKLEIQGNWRWL